MVRQWLQTSLLTLDMYESLLRKPQQSTDERVEMDLNSNETCPISVRQTLQDCELPTQAPEVKSGEKGVNLPKL